MTDAVLKHPHAVLLLDEVEKAHPDIFNLLLQVMDNGTLTDSNGRKADFRNVILVMTTNAGAELVDRPSIGFTISDHGTDWLAIIRRLFSPEFRNRLDAIVQFKGLTTTIIAQVVDKFLTELENQLESKRVTVEVDKEGRAWLARRGYDPKMGARPMARIIQERIKRRLADELLFGRLTNGGHVTVTVRNGDLNVEVDEKEKQCHEI
jgi:ATP-dependent Clp protease ATP-binding subunit ClpA